MLRIAILGSVLLVTIDPARADPPIAPAAGEIDPAARLAKLEAELRAERAERTRYDVAEVEYRDHAIQFADQDETAVIPVDHTLVWTSSHRWRAYVGDDPRQGLDGADFYRTVGRADLAASYERRSSRGVGVAAAGGAAMLFGGFLLAGTDGPSNGAYHGTGFALLGGGVIALGIGLYYARHPDPVSEDDARELAADYNTTLRHHLHHPTVTRVQWSPFAGASGGGMALAGAF